MTRYSKTMTEALQEIREGFSAKQIKMAIGVASDKRYAGGNYDGAVDAIEKIKKGLSNHPQVAAVLKRQNEDNEKELDERKFESGKSASGYDIFHKDFSSAMQHATAFAKSKGQPIKKDEIDNKVATGPRKPSPGKENSYTLETEKGKRWSVQVYNMGSKFELNMYLTSSYVPEGEELTEGKMKDRLMKAQDLMGPSKNREQGIEFVMKGLKVSKKEATKLVDAVLDMVMNNEVEIDEMKMNDPKLNKIFDKLKRGDTVKLKTSSTINQGKDFVEYIVKAKNTVNKGRVEKITLVTKGNEKAVKKFLYKRDGQVTFAIGDMGASIDDIKEGFFSKEYEKGQYKNGDEKPFVDAIKKAGGKNIDVQKPTNRDPMLTIEFDGDVKRAQKEVDKVGDGTEDIDEKLGKNADAGDYIDDFKKSDAPQFKGKSDKKKKDMAIAAYLDAKDKKEEVELDEAVKYQFVAIDRLGKVIGFASDERDAKDMARRGHTMDSPSKGKGVVGRNKAKVVKLKKPMSDKQGDMMINRDFDMNKFGGETTYSIGIKEEPEKKMDKPDSAKAVDQSRDDKKKTRIAQLQLQIAKATETINKLNTQEKPDA